MNITIPWDNRLFYVRCQDEIMAYVLINKNDASLYEHLNGINCPATLRCILDIETMRIRLQDWNYVELMDFAKASLI
jgi:hypothetical protein